MSNNSQQELPLNYFHRVSSHRGQAPNAEIFNGEVEYALVVKESPAYAFLSLRGDPNDAGFCAAVTDILELNLSTRGNYHCSSQSRIYWLGPDEWLLVSEIDASVLEARLREAMSGHISIVDVSGGHTLVNLRGAPMAIDSVLKKSCIYDFAGWPNAGSGKGRCAQTTFAKASALVSNRTDGSFDLIIRRSFADYIALWMLDAGREFGLRIEG